MDHSKEVIQVLSVDAGYGHHAVVRDVSFTAGEGHLVAILGFNGTGKSTLLRTICGLQIPLKGKVHLFGNDLHAMHVHALARQVSVVLSGRGEMIQTLFVYEVLALARSPYQDNMGRTTHADTIIIDEIVDRMHITHLLNRRLYQLSDGEAQKVMIARALVQQTPVIVLDEPTSHLDLHHKLEVFSLLRKLSQEGKTVLFTSHEIDLALEVAGHALLVGQHGACVYGEKDTLLRTGHVQAYFEHGMVKFDPELKRFTYTL